MVLPVIATGAADEALPLTIPKTDVAPVVVPETPACKLLAWPVLPIRLLSIVKAVSADAPVTCMPINVAPIAAALPTTVIPEIVLPVPLVGPILTVLVVLFVHMP